MWKSSRCVQAHWAGLGRRAVGGSRVDTVVDHTGGNDGWGGVVQSNAEGGTDIVQVRSACVLKGEGRWALKLQNIIVGRVACASVGPGKAERGGWLRRSHRPPPQTGRQASPTEEAMHDNVQELKLRPGKGEVPSGGSLVGGLRARQRVGPCSCAAAAAALPCRRLSPCLHALAARPPVRHLPPGKCHVG